MSQPRDSRGYPLFVAEPREGSEAIFTTHDFTDATTWYGQSVRVVDEAATDSGDGLLWTLAQSDLIDLVHGKCMDEEAIIAAQQKREPSDPHGYVVIVKVDSVVKTARAAYASDGGDYEVNYETGDVTFFATQAGNTVEVSYSYANGSEFCLQPEAGKDLDIESAEAQFSDDLDMLDTIEFEVQGFVESYASDLWDQQSPTGVLPFDSGDALPTKLNDGDRFYRTSDSTLHEWQSGAPVAVAAGGVPGGTLIVLSVKKYKRLDQLIDEAMGAFPVIPAIGGATRGNAKQRFGFPFRYGTIRHLHSSTGMKLLVRLTNDTEFGGERATATFYCTSKSQS